MMLAVTPPKTEAKINITTEVIIIFRAVVLVPSSTSWLAKASVSAMAILSSSSKPPISPNKDKVSECVLRIPRPLVSILSSISSNLSKRPASPGSSASKISTKFCWASSNWASVAWNTCSLFSLPEATNLKASIWKTWTPWIKLVR